MRTAADPRFGDLRFIISDFRDVQGHGITEADLEAVAVTRIGSSCTNPNIRIAVIAPRVDVARLREVASSQRYPNPYETKVLHNPEEARRWCRARPRQESA